MNWAVEADSAALRHAMDHTAWTLRREADGIEVHSGFPVFRAGGAPHPAEGFWIRGEAEATLDEGFRYFRDACHFASTANAMTTKAEVIEVLVDEPRSYRALVRTGFALPWPLQDREFLHWVAARHDGETVEVVYATAESGPSPWPGYRRCPMAPSGQRLTAIAPGRLRAEHCMTYDLGGRVGSWAQNWLFHRGHVQAYFDEWAAAMRALSGGTGPTGTR